MKDIFVGNVPDSQRCHLWRELKISGKEKFVLVNFQLFTP